MLSLMRSISSRAMRPVSKQLHRRMFGISWKASSLCHGVPVLKMRPPRLRMFWSSWYISLMRSRSAAETRSFRLMMSSVNTLSACLPVSEAPQPSPRSWGAPDTPCLRFVDTADCVARVSTSSVP